MENKNNLEEKLQPLITEVVMNKNVLKLISLNFDVFTKDQNYFIKQNEEKLKSYLEAHLYSTIKKDIFENLITPFYRKVTGLKEDQNNTSKTTIREELPTIIESHKVKRGRPAGSKNKPKTKHTNLPIHTCNDKNVGDAILDLLHYKNGLTYKQIKDQLVFENFSDKKFAQEFFYLERISLIRKTKNVRGVELWYPKSKRNAFFYNNNIYSLDELETISFIDRSTIYKRISCGLNIYEALDKPIRSKKS
jgi:hypothetical protein